MTAPQQQQQRQQPQQQLQLGLKFSSQQPPALASSIIAVDEPRPGPVGLAARTSLAPRVPVAPAGSALVRATPCSFPVATVTSSSSSSSSSQHQSQCQQRYGGTELSDPHNVEMLKGGTGASGGGGGGTDWEQRWGGRWRSDTTGQQRIVRTQRHALQLRGSASDAAEIREEEARCSAGTRRFHGRNHCAQNVHCNHAQQRKTPSHRQQQQQQQQEANSSMLDPFDPSVRIEWINELGLLGAANE